MGRRLSYSIIGTGLTGRKNVATLPIYIAGFFTVHEYIIVLLFDEIGGNFTSPSTCSSHPISPPPTPSSPPPLLPSSPPPLLPSSPQEATLSRSELTHDHVMMMHHTSVEGVDDMASLGDLHEAAILYNIQQRYSKDVIYVSLTQATQYR